MLSLPIFVCTCPQMYKVQARSLEPGIRILPTCSFVKLHEQLCPVRLFAGPEAHGKCDPL